MTLVLLLRDGGRLNLEASGQPALQKAEARMGWSWHRTLWSTEALLWFTWPGSSSADEVRGVVTVCSWPQLGMQQRWEREGDSLSCTLLPARASLVGVQASWELVSALDGSAGQKARHTCTLHDAALRPDFPFWPHQDTPSLSSCRLRGLSFFI